jgi:glycogen(starch) synthase
MVVHVLFPDSMEKPVGGLGVQFNEIYKRIKDKVEFEIMGFPTYNPAENYHNVINIMPDLGHAAISNIANQITYFYESARAKKKPDIIHAYDWTVYLAGVFAARLHNVPLVCSMNLSIVGLRMNGMVYCGNYDSYDGYWIQSAHEFSEALGMEHADKIIHVSKNYAENFKPFLDKTVVIQNGIDFNFWKEESKFKFPFAGKNKKKIVYIGRMTPMKGILPLCQAEIPEDIDLYFVGDMTGGDEMCYGAMIDKCNGKNIFHLGYLQGEEKRAALQGADAVIMPSLHEPFGIVGLEALASKSILISSFTDGISDYLPKNIGIYCGKTKEEIEKAIKKFKSMSDKEIEKRKNIGFKIAEKYDWDKLAEEYYQTYEEVLKNKHTFVK